MPRSTQAVPASLRDTALAGRRNPMYRLGALRPKPPDLQRRPSPAIAPGSAATASNYGAKDGRIVRPDDPPAPLGGVSSGLISTVDALPEPIQHLALNPADPVGAKPYPPGELARRLQACDVLRRVQDQILDLPFR